MIFELARGRKFSGEKKKIIVRVFMSQIYL